MRKIINSATAKYEDELTDNLVLDAVPTVNSFNSVTSDAVARAVAGASGEVPQVTENDNGKVLTAIYDAGGPAVEWGAIPEELPDSTGASQGDVLTVGSSGLEWAGVPSELPDSTGASQGDVLTVGSSGLEWAGVPTPTVDQNYSSVSANAQSGVAVSQAIAAIPTPPTYTAGDGIDITSGEVSVKAGTGLSFSAGTTGEMTLEATLNSVGYIKQYNSIGRLNAQAVAAIKNNASLNVKILETYSCINKVTSGGPDFRLAILPIYPDNPASPSIGSGALISSTNISSSLFQIVPMSETYMVTSNTQVTVDFANLSEMSDLSWSTIEASPTDFLLMIVSALSSSSLNYANKQANGDWPSQLDAAKIEYTIPGDGTLNVDLPVPSTTGASQGDVLSIGSSGIEWATPSAGGSPLVVKDIDMSSASTTSDSNKTTITVPLSSADQFYALGKQIAVCYTTSNTTTAVTSATIRLYYTLDNQSDLYIPMPANNYATSQSQCYWAGGLIVGFEPFASEAPDPSQGWPFTKIEIVVEGIMWSPARSESIKVHLLG